MQFKEYVNHVVKNAVRNPPIPCALSFVLVRASACGVCNALDFVLSLLVLVLVCRA